MVDEVEGRYIKLNSEDGHSLDAWYCSPNQPSKGNLIVLQEIFGVNAHIRSVTGRFAALGYSALAPAMFDRIAPGIEMDYGEGDAGRGLDCMHRSPDATTLLDIQAALAWLRNEQPGEADRKLPVATIGYCWGGSLSYLAGSRIDGLACAIVYYGAQIMPWLPESPRIPWLGHFGEHDGRIPLGDVDAIREANPDAPVHVYLGADHGFNCDMRGSWHPESAQLALQRSLEFLTVHFGC